MKLALASLGMLVSVDGLSFFENPKTFRLRTQRKKTFSGVTEPPFSLENISGAVEPLGIFDPLELGARADEATLKRYREAELTHGRVAMLAVVGILTGEAVAGSSLVFDASVKGPAITHLSQVPAPFWTALLMLIYKYELDRAEIGWVSPKDVDFDNPGLLRVSYTPGDLDFDPLSLKPYDPIEFKTMQNKELQNGRLAMIGAAGFLAQELVDGKGIVEHWQSR